MRHSITVIIPTRDRPDYLVEAVASVLEAASRVSGRAQVEVLVVDNSSESSITDRSRRIASDAGASFLVSTPAGVSRARNAGIAAARGELIGFLDDDDAYDPRALELLLDALESHEHAAAVFGQQILCDATLQPVFGPVPDGPFPQGEALAFSMATIIGWNPVLVRRAALLELGGFDESISQSEDWELQMRVASRHDLFGIEAPIALIRQHERRPVRFDQWISVQRECRQVERSGRRLQGRQPISRYRRWASTWGHRGRSAHGALSHARRWLSVGERGQAALFVMGACWRSFPHTVRLIPEFMDVGSGLLLPSRRGRTTSAN